MRLSRQPRQIKREYLSLGRLEPAGLGADIGIDKTYNSSTDLKGAETKETFSVSSLVEKQTCCLHDLSLPN